MFKVHRNKILLLVALLLILLGGCARNTDSKGEILPDRLISKETTFSHMMDKGGGLYDAIIVYPMAQGINYLSDYVGVVLAIGVVTLIVNAIIFPISMKSTRDSQKMQLLQPELDRINEKYKDRNDERSNMAKSQEVMGLYKKYDIKIGSMMLGSFLPLPIMLAMWGAVQRAYAVRYGTFLGLDLHLSPQQGFFNEHIPWYLVIFVIVNIVQAVSMLLPQWLAKRRLKQSRSYKAYDKPKKSSNPNGMMYAMLVMIIVFSFTWPTAMSVYWFFSSAVNIVKTFIAQPKMEGK
ncbi:MAG: membrane protein insertase YidC [Erysipelotrichaceae bacterium]|nr:membrane protein insertase YidC [Erysipelotrichaceae bacterium]